MGLLPHVWMNSPLHSKLKPYWHFMQQLGTRDNQSRQTWTDSWEEELATQADSYADMAQGCLPLDGKLPSPILSDVIWVTCGSQHHDDLSTVCRNMRLGRIEWLACLTHPDTSFVGFTQTLWIGVGNSRPTHPRIWIPEFLAITGSWFARLLLQSDQPIHRRFFDSCTHNCMVIVMLESLFI